MNEHEQSAPCTSCKGAKMVFHKGFTSLEGKVYPDEMRACYKCEGRGEFPAVDFADILKRIIATKGKNKGRIRESFPSPSRSEGVNANRAYYVWRIARFNGGRDMTMPMTAHMLINGDPHQKALETFSDIVAKKFFGTDMAAAQAWHRAFYG